MPTTPTERATGLPPRLEAAADDVRAKKTVYETALELRDDLIVQALDEEGLSWRAVQRLTKLAPASIQQAVGNAAKRRAARAAERVAQRGD